MPLAIELVASQAKAYSPAELLELLKRRPTLVSGGPRDWPARHRTLRRAIDWSYDLLGEEEKSLFSVLALFAGECTLTAAEAVCGPFYAGDVARGLATLVEHNLIQRLIREGDVRFTMLAPIREYALERLERSGRREEAGRRYAEYYAELAETARLEWKGPRQAFWLKQLSAEVDNLRAALDWTLVEAADAARLQAGAKTAYALGTAFWEVQGRFREERFWLERALGYRDRLPAATQVRLLNLAGWYAQLQGEYDVAGARYEEGLALARQEEDAVLISMSLHSLGTMAGRRGDYERARPLLEEAMATEREASGGAMTAHLSTILNNLAIVCKHLGEHERAAALLEESLAFKRAQGDRLRVAALLLNLALVRDDYAALHEPLGAAHFAAAWSGGETMTLGQAAACALWLPPTRRHQCRFQYRGGPIGLPRWAVRHAAPKSRIRHRPERQGQTRG
ncbi:MAG: ATP-binding protein [Chloroflexia bacterium]